MSVVSLPVAGPAAGAVRVMDRTLALDPGFPVIILPSECCQTIPFTTQEISAHDDLGCGVDRLFGRMADNDDFELTPEINLRWKHRHGRIPAGV